MKCISGIPSFTIIVPMLSRFSSSQTNTLSLLGLTKSSMNCDKNSSVSSRSFSVKKKISPSLNESGTWIAVGSEISNPSSSNLDFIMSILSCLSSSTISSTGDDGSTTPETFCKYASNASS